MVEQLQKIVMVGPVFPFKGGISHYTGLMFRNLNQKYDVSMISYKMQYPKILFRKEQRDYKNDAFKIENTEYLINTSNPFNWSPVAKRIRELKPDLVIFQWWHPYFAFCYKAIIKRLKGVKILFLCHNVFPHERFPMDNKLTKSTLSKGDYFIVHSKMDAEDLLSIKSDAKYKVAVHPTYNAFKFENADKGTSREKLGLSPSEKVLLFFGFVREYKGLKHLIRALPQITEKFLDAKLLIVGDFGKNKQEYIDLIDSLGVGNHLKIYDDYIPDREVEKFFAAADLVVLPYESATQSGIVQIAYGFNKPVIATKVGGLPEVVLDGKTGYIAQPQNPKEIAVKVIYFFEQNKAAEFEENVKNEAYKYDWDRMRETVENLWFLK